PNVGKSSFVNRAVGQKVAIVSAKPQTTRTRIMGVLSVDETHLVFTDTPGFHKPKTKLGEKMIKAVDETISGVDACLFVVEPMGELRPTEEELLKKFAQQKARVVLAINKVDTVPEKENLMKRILEFSQLYNFEAIVPVSAVKGDNMEPLLDELMKLAEEGYHFFPEDTLTDQPERVLAAEMIREKLLRNLDKEIPHGTAVSIERMRERDDADILDIEAIIYCEKESHKGIIIGKKGAMLKKIGELAREDIEQFMGTKVFLQTWVKVKENWRDSMAQLRNFGFGE
ncbi:MAG: GTPase Era, partial [Oscillospiraceae bacterium]|nr:GTPase Era [Oscillospiraceae bacterium]